MRVLLIGPPASGKGTQGRRIGARYALAYLSSGELLRSEISQGTPLGQRVAAHVSNGDLVPDQVVVDLLRGPMTSAAGAGGWVLDGFPRTLGQARAAHDLARETGGDVQLAVAFDVAHDELVLRMRRRAETEGRADDTDGVLSHRVAVYTEQTEPLLDLYAQAGVLARIDGGTDVDAVTTRVFELLDERFECQPGADGVAGITNR